MVGNSRSTTRLPPEFRAGIAFASIGGWLVKSPSVWAIRFPHGVALWYPSTGTLILNNSKGDGSRLRTWQGVFNRLRKMRFGKRRKLTELT